MVLLEENVFGNPHSKKPTSQAMPQPTNKSRDYVLEYFNASPDEYVVIFTSNASGALKLFELYVGYNAEMIIFS